MVDVTGDQVNALLRAVKTIVRGGDGEQELTLLTVSLCVAARSCQVDPLVLMEQVGRYSVDVSTIDLILLPRADGG